MTDAGLHEKFDSLPGAKSPLVELLALAAPTMAQMASYTVMQFIDTWMLHFQGDAAPTAAANSGMMALSVVGFGMGVIWVVNTLVSQHFGAGSFERCGRYLWQGVWFAVVYSAVVTVAAIPLAAPMFRAFGHPQPIVALEAVYFRILVAGSVLKLVSTAFGQFLLAIDKPAWVLVSALSGVGVNIIAAWILVFGHLGVHPMGVRGAAIGQNIGVACEMLVLIVFAFGPKLAARFGVMRWRPRAAEMRTLLVVGLPSGAQFIADILAWSLFCNVVIGVIGEKAMAANTFMMRFMVVSFMPAFGLSIAVTALSGRYIGMKRTDLVIKRANLAFAVTAAYMMACGAGFFLGRHQLMRLFTHDPQILAIGAKYLTYAAIYQFFDALYIVYNGALRGAGDTFVPAVATAVLCWGITLLGGYLAAQYWHAAGPGGPWLVATVYGVIVGIFMYERFRRGKWKLIRLEPDESGGVPPSNVAAGSTTLPGLDGVD